MAKSDSVAEVRNIISDIRKKNCRSVYILMGEEAYFIDLIIENLEKYVIPEEDKDFNLNVFYGNDADVDYVIGVAQQFPVMAQKKLVILKEAQSMHQAKNQLERFSSYIAQPNPQTVFAIAFKGDMLNAGSKILKSAKENGAVIFRSAVPRDYEISRYIRDYCQDNKVGIEEKAIDLLAQYIGPPLSKLYGEINKLILINGGKNAKITCDDIEKNIGISKDFNNYELLNAIGRKDYARSMNIIKYFKANPKSNPTPVTTATLFNYFSNIVIAHYLPDKTDQSLSKTFGFKNSFQLQELKIALRNYNPKQAVNAIHHIREFDSKSKGIGSMLNEYDLLVELIFKLFT